MTKQHFWKLLKTFKPLLKRYQIGLEISIRGNDFIFDCVHLLYYKRHKINFKWRGSYTGSTDWIRNKKATINLTNKKDSKCFWYAIIVALDHEEIGKHLERITKIKPFTDKYNWEEINYSWEKDDVKKFEKNNLMTALTAFYAKNTDNGEKWHYLAVKKLLALWREITSKHCSDFCCLNCLHSFATKNKRESNEKVCENKDFWNFVMSSKEIKILEFNQY